MYSTFATLFSEINNNNFNEQTIFTFGKDKWPFLSYDTINLEMMKNETRFKYPRLFYS